MAGFGGSRYSYTPVQTRGRFHKSSLEWGVSMTKDGRTLWGSGAMTRETDVMVINVLDENLDEDPDWTAPPGSFDKRWEGYRFEVDFTADEWAIKCTNRDLEAGWDIRLYQLGVE